MMTRAALRACARVAWRQAKRAPGRSALVITMVGLPIAALTLGATLIRTAVPTLEEHVYGQMGSAELRVYPQAPDVDARALEALLPAGSRVVVVQQWNRTEVVDGTLVYASVWEPSIPIDQPPIPGLYELMDGRAPTRPGEAAVDPRMLEIYRVGIGDELTIGEMTFRVVGVAARPLQMWEPLVAVAPGTLPPVDPHAVGTFLNGVLIDLPDGADVAAAESALVEHLIGDIVAGGFMRDRAEAEYYAAEAITTREEVAAQMLNDAPVLTGVSFAGTALALFATGLIAAAAFAVGIRRQLRMLGLVGATGGEPRHVRAVVLLGGTTLGMVGAGIGVAVGVAGAYGVTPHLHRYIHALPGPVALHLPTLLGAALLGVIAATAAAAWPARIAARVSTLDSLAARLPAPKPPGRLARRGLVVAGLGAVLTASGFSQDNDVIPGVGLVLMVSGFLVSVPLLMSVAGRFAPRMPTATRLAVRDTARHGRRTGTAIAAAALALMVPVGVAALSLSEEAYQARKAPLGDDHLLIGRYEEDVFEHVAVPDSVPAAVREALPGAIIVRIRHAVFDPQVHPTLVERGGRTFAEPATIARAVSHHADRDGSSSFGYEASSLWVGGAELLRALHAEDGIPALEAGTIVGIGPGSVQDGMVQLHLPPDGSDELQLRDVPAVEAGSIAREGDFLIPRYVISEDGARALDLLPGWAPMYGPAHDLLVATGQPLNGELIGTVKEIASADPTIFVQTAEDFLPQFDAARLAATGGAAVVALAIVAVTVALVSAEARRDQAILVAVGATPRARRRIAAARAGLVGALAGGIAVPAGFSPIAVMQLSRPDDFPVIVPWIPIAVVLFLVPAIAAGWGWLTSRAPRSSALLQPVA
ncbi:MAG TPA: FtsX-like permease family protein [Actinomycetota bacterium]